MDTASIFRIHFWALFLTCLLLITSTARGGTASDRLREVDSSMRSVPRPILVQLTTTWCQYCRMQQRVLERDDNFKTLLPLFYYVEFDAESREELVFNGRKYRYSPTGIHTGIHELALTLGGEEALAYPAWILLDKHYKVVFRYNGVLRPDALKALMNAIAQMAVAEDG